MKTKSKLRSCSPSNAAACSGLGLFRRLMVMVGCDYVVLRHHDNKHLIRNVKWLGGRAFAASYQPETASQLLPAGEVIGPCYVEEWIPITPRTHAVYYQNEKCAATGSERNDHD